MLIERNRGFSLIEILVTLLILSIGLLGLAGLQLSGLRYNQSAYLRTQATAAISDLVDKMRANPKGVAAGKFAAVDSASPPAASADCTATGCTPEELAEYDIKSWIGLVERLPGGAGTVSYDADADVYKLTVSWREVAHEDDSADTSSSAVTVNVRL